MPAMLDDFLKLLAGETPEGIVWTADLSYWMAGRGHDGTTDTAWGNEKGYLQLHRDLGVMPYYYYNKFWVAKTVYDGTIRSRTETEGNRTVSTMETPVGALRQISSFLPQSCCQGVEEYMVETEADLDVMLCMLEHRRLEPCNLDDYPQRRKLWEAYDGLPCLGLPRSPLPSLVTEWAGLQNTVMLMLDCPDKTQQILSLLTEQEAPILEAVCELAPPVIHFPDNLSSENLTGYYDEHMRERHRHRLGLLHAAGVKAAVHLDGTVRGLLPKLIDAGFDAVEALTPTPAGDISVDEMRELAGAAPTILWGGVPGAMFAPPYGWDAMRRHIEHVLEAWGSRPFILGVADQVPPDGDVDFCRRIADMVKARAPTTIPDPTTP